MNEQIERRRGVMRTVLREAIAVLLEPITLARTMEARKMGWWSVAPVAIPVAFGVLQAASTRSALAGILFGGVIWLAEGAIIHLARSVPGAKIVS